MRESDFRETSVEYMACDDFATLYSSENKWISRMRKYAYMYPEEVRVVQDNKDGMAVRIPKNWLRVAPPRKGKPMSAEQKAAAAERLRKARERKNVETPVLEV